MSKHKQKHSKTHLSPWNEQYERNPFHPFWRPPSLSNHVVTQELIPNRLLQHRLATMGGTIGDFKQIEHLKELSTSFKTLIGIDKELLMWKISVRSVLMSVISSLMTIWLPFFNFFGHAKSGSLDNSESPSLEVWALLFAADFRTCPRGTA